MCVIAAQLMFYLKHKDMRNILATSLLLCISMLPQSESVYYIIQSLSGLLLCEEQKDLQELLTHFKLGHYMTEKPDTSSSHIACGFVLGKDWVVLSSPKEWLTPSLKKGQESRFSIDEGALLPEKDMLHFLLKNIKR